MTRPRRRARALRGLRLANPVVRAVLRSPAHRLLDRSLLLLTYHGRRSGRAFTIPVMYAEDGDRLVVLAARPGEKLWWRSIGDGAPVELRLRGATVRGAARVLAEAGERRTALTAYLRRFPRAAATLGVAPSLQGAERERALERACTEVALVEVVPERDR